ncbi:MAG: 2-oxoglutarate dehydrogenase E1 component [Cytophagales bacterium]
MDKYSYIANAHGDYIENLYSEFKSKPDSVDESWQKFFEGFEFASKNWDNGEAVSSGDFSLDEVKVYDLIERYREYGHLISNTNPVRQRLNRNAGVELKDVGLSESDLEKEFHAGHELGLGKATLKSIVERCKKIFGQTIGFDYYEIREPEIRQWFKDKSEKEYLNLNLSKEEKMHILSKLNEAVVFENFLHTKYIGQKRFSLEGGESTIPALDAMINTGADLGIESIVIGMAHRGRLNVLANTMKKTYEEIFNEFEGNAPPSTTMGDGDVKYHLGFSSSIKATNGTMVKINLAPNPSHLEAVNPVVEGFIRAKSDYIFDDNVSKVLPILIHGDAALAGQGIVYEVAQMSKLKGYHTGGTIHFVINNQLGFTTDFQDARSSIYSTDIADIIDSPVLHVNGDDPEAVTFASRIAVEFRQKFHRDIFVDMVCYRRHGHNESDEPKFTQPKLYNTIAKHPNPREVYNKALIERGDSDANIAKQMDKAFRSLLQDRLNMVKEKKLSYSSVELGFGWEELRNSKPTDFDKSPNTGIKKAQIDAIGKALCTVPKDFKPLKQIDRLLKERNKMFFEEKQLNWAAGELLAYGSLLAENQVVRISGQDVIRGTFSHRHSILFDAESNEPYSNLDFIQENQQKLRIYNSLLSEFAVLGFEFGYAMANPHALVIWEAQFGDFANGAQVMIDQFIAAAESKWDRMNGLVMLLPHGYEGQGPEHSSARLERFLQLSANYNMIVTNITTPANLFHGLRRQLAWPFRKPLINMSPKSLLRNPACVSPISEFTKGNFQEVIDDTVDAKKVDKLVLCSGKIFYEIHDEREKQEKHNVAIVRIEQLHPLPEKQLEAIFKKYSKAKCFFVQEEPENMGSWNYLMRYYRKRDIEVICRKASASPATGFHKKHAEEQKNLINKALE